MPGAFQVIPQLTGDRELDIKLKNMPNRMRNKAIRWATRDGAKIIQADAKKYAPHDTGALERSLTVRAAKKSNGGRLSRYIIGHAVATRASLFQGEEFYGGFQEFGTRHRFTSNNEWRGEIEAREFLREALYTNADRLRRVFRQRVQQAIREMGAA